MTDEARSDAAGKNDHQAAPRRHRPGEHTLEAWESLVDRAIREARASGEFENLRGTGQPILIERNPYAGDRELAFHALKNADLEPYWMSLDKELTVAFAALDRTLSNAANRAGDLRERVCGGHREARATPPLPRWRRWIMGSDNTSGQSGKTLTLAAASQMRHNWRERYLAQAAQLDRRIVEYNRALPDEIRWLERARLLPADAARRFDERCPPITCLAS